MKSVISRKITFPGNADIDFGREINNKLCEIYTELPELMSRPLTVSFTIDIGQAEGKSLRKDLSEMLYDALIRKSEITTWARYGNFFDFAEKRFTVGGEEIYLTVGERLLLFRLLVLEEEMVGDGKNMARDTIKRLRRRYGTGFLRGCFNPNLGIA